MSKMFKLAGKVMETWNPFTGCFFNCTYCWARPLALGKLARSYTEGFVPKVHPDRLKKHWDCEKNLTVFVSDMGDISYCPWGFMEKIFETIDHNFLTDFLFLTKNPIIYYKSTYIPDNVIYGATIETNRDIAVSAAPPPSERLRAMIGKSHKVLISIEPVMDFDLPVFTDSLLRIMPNIVQIGADNYHNNLPEPSWSKVQKLIQALEKEEITVERKPGLERLAAVK